jgi:hypothetical protein
MHNRLNIGGYVGNSVNGSVLSGTTSVEVVSILWIQMGETGSNSRLEKVIHGYVVLCVGIR